MNLIVCSVRDSLVGFGTTFTAVSKEVAIRGFTNSIVHMLESDDYVDVNPEDLSLYMVGEFDSVDGVLSPCEPGAIARGHSIVTEYRLNSSYSNTVPGGDLNDNNES